MYMRNVYFYCNKETIVYFDDYINSICSKLGVDTSCICLHTKYLNPRIKLGDVLILMQTDKGIDITEGIDLNRYKKMDLYVINTEQMTNKESFDKMIGLKDKYKNLPIKFIDYSEDNVVILRENGFDAYFIPFQYNPLEVGKLKRFAAVDRVFDIGTIGFETPRREMIFDELEKFGFRINRLCKYGALWNDERDEVMGKSKIILNVHAFSDYTVYESMRCCRWLFTGEMLIVAETSLNQDKLDVKDMAIFVDYEDIVKTVIDVFLKYDEYMEKHREYVRKNVERIDRGRGERLLELIK